MLETLQEKEGPADSLSCKGIQTEPHPTITDRGTEAGECSHSEFGVSQTDQVRCCLLTPLSPFLPMSLLCRELLFPEVFLGSTSPLVKLQVLH